MMRFLLVFTPCFLVIGMISGIYLFVKEKGFKPSNHLIAGIAIQSQDIARLQTIYQENIAQRYWDNEATFPALQRAASHIGSELQPQNSYVKELHQSNDKQFFSFQHAWPSYWVDIAGQTKETCLVLVAYEGSSSQAEVLKITLPILVMKSLNNNDKNYRKRLQLVFIPHYLTLAEQQQWLQQHRQKTAGDITQCIQITTAEIMTYYRDNNVSTNEYKSQMNYWKTVAKSVINNCQFMQWQLNLTGQVASEETALLVAKELQQLILQQIE